VLRCSPACGVHTHATLIAECAPESSPELAQGKTSINGDVQVAPEHAPLCGQLDYAIGGSARGTCYPSLSSFFEWACLIDVCVVWFLHAADGVRGQ
jgi:hypothetical protein